MASPRKPLRKTLQTAARPARAAATNPAPTQVDATAATSVEWLRSVVNASISASRDWVQQLDRMQRMNAQAVQELARGFDEAVAEAARARSVEELVAVQAELASSQMARIARHFGSMMTQWMDAEVALVEHVQDDAAKLSRQVLGSKTFDTSPTLPWPSADVAPLALLGSAQNALTEMTGQWVQAVRSVAARAQLPQV